MFKEWIFENKKKEIGLNLHEKTGFIKIVPSSTMYKYKQFLQNMISAVLYLPVTTHDKI